MARAKIELPAPESLRALIDAGQRLAVRVTPGARVELLSIEGQKLSAKVRAKPQDGAANDAVCRLVAQALQIAPSRVTLLRGATSRDKLLGVEL